MRSPGPNSHGPRGVAEAGYTIHGTPGPIALGSPDEAAAECPRCGKPHPLRIRFCPNCGLKVDADGGSRAAGAKVQPGSVSLLLLRGMGASGTSFRLKDEVNQVGRTEGLIRFPSDDTLSPLAASFFYRGGRLYVRDEGGPSGVFLRLNLPAVLLPNDWFSIGDKLLRFLGRVPPPHPEPTVPRHLGSMRTGSGPLLRIQLVHLGGVGGRVFALPAPLRIGRALGEVIFGDDPFISTRHCELDVDPAGAVIRDLGSSNGTFIRLAAGSERELNPGDTIRLGRNILRVDP